MPPVRPRVNAPDREEPAVPSDRVALARRLIEVESRDGAIQELLIREGRDAADVVQVAADRHPALKVSGRDLLGRYAEVAARRFLEDRADSDDDGSSRILDYAPGFPDDLCLGVACSKRPRNNTAWNMLVLSHQRELSRTARDEGFVSQMDDEVNAFLADLWVERRSGGCFLGTYAGLAPMRGWLLLVFRRRLARRRGARSAVAALPQELSVRIADPAAPDPQSVAQHRDLRARVVPIVQAAMRDLSPRDRDLLESRLLRGEEGQAIASRHGVSPSYVSRRFREITERVRTRLTPWLREHGIDPEELA